MFVGGPTWETIGLEKKMTNGLLSKSSSTMVLPPGQKMVLGLLHPCIYAQPHPRLQAVVKIITKEFKGEKGHIALRVEGH
jgi:hypothetical protein